MKKLAAFAVFAAITASAAMASAAAIDSAGTADVSIKAPTAKVAAAAPDRVALDSLGNFTAAPVKVVAAAVSPAKAENKQTCLDSYCKVVL